MKNTTDNNEISELVKSYLDQFELVEYKSSNGKFPNEITDMIVKGGKVFGKISNDYGIGYNILENRKDKFCIFDRIEGGVFSIFDENGIVEATFSESFLLIDEMVKFFGENPVTDPLDNLGHHLLSRKIKD